MCTLLCMGRKMLDQKDAAERTFFAEAVCCVGMSLATRFIWLPLTGARARRVGVLASVSRSEACCLATGSAAACCGLLLLLLLPKRKMLSIAGSSSQGAVPREGGRGGPEASFWARSGGSRWRGVALAAVRARCRRGVQTGP
jgi:hypothetical protein